MVQRYVIIGSDYATFSAPFLTGWETEGGLGYLRIPQRRCAGALGGCGDFAV